MANVEDGLPPINVAFGPERNVFSLIRNHIATTLVKRIFRPIRESLDEQRRLWGLPVYEDFFNDRFASGPQICQEPPSFEFPRQALPANFHFVGPLHKQGTAAVHLFHGSDWTVDHWFTPPWGHCKTGWTGYSRHSQKAARGWMCSSFFPCAAILILRHSKGWLATCGGSLQLELLERSNICITHAGLNTALEALAQGVPMVAIPITNDQPGVAARITWTGAGRTINLKKLSPESLRRAVADVAA